MKLRSCLFSRTTTKQTSTAKGFVIICMHTYVLTIRANEITDHIKILNMKTLLIFISLKIVEHFYLGIRQHHCRHCGKAICDSCSSNRINIPIMGFEFDVRICNPCFSELQTVE